MNNIEKYSAALLRVLIMTTWIAGVVLAAGWLKLAASVFPPYAWYLAVERVMQLVGMVK